MKHLLTAEPWQYRPARPDDFVERQGGYVVALAAGIVALALLVVTVPAKAPDPAPPQTLKLRLVKPLPPPPEPEEPQEETPPAPVQEAVATTVNPVETETEQQPVEVAMAQPSEQSVQELIRRPESLREWEPRSAEEQQKLARLLNEVENVEDELEVQETDVKARLNKAIIESVGREFIINSDGGREGMIRTIDVSGFPKDIVERTLNRYGITIEYKQVSGPDGQRRTFVNSATTDQGTFTSVRRDGFYEVFVLSAKATAMLSTLEMRALQDRGHEPMRTRIRRVQFGIVQDTEFGGGHMLGVTELEVERIR